ncbi:uncharacterized protein LOC134784234 [Penaeus indicus]|uniref:uncharacterized protein LOC134784234 n=1 Tax=Penaeus indicus TaxID=29960 RepID=UPI00300DA56C
MPVEPSCCTFVVSVIIGLGWVVGAVMALTYLSDADGLFVLVVMSVMFICGATFWYIYRERGGEADSPDQDDSLEGEEAAEQEERPAAASEEQRLEDAPPPYETVILLPPSYEQLYSNDLISPSDLTKAKSNTRLSCPDVVPES